MEQTKLIAQAKVAFCCKNQGYISEQVQCFYSASFSGFLTMAGYMCHHYPDLGPPGCPTPQTNIKDTDEFPSPNLSLNKYLEPWCDFFNELLCQSHERGRVAEKEKVLFLICTVDDEYFTKLKNILNMDKFEQFSSDDCQALLQNCKFCIPKELRIRVGIINFATSQMSKDVFEPKVNLLSLFTGIWYQHVDSWRSYNVLKNDYPTEEDIMRTDIFILSGSSMSVNQKNKAVEKTMSMMIEGLKKNNKLKILGLCFGHQAIAHYFGGKVIKKQMFPGIQIVTFNKQNLGNFSHFSAIQECEKDSYLVTQFHSDYVTEVPEGFVTLATSASTEHQAIMSLDGRVLTFQFHCEYTKGYAFGFEERLRIHCGIDLRKDNPRETQKIQKHGIARHFESCKIIRDVVRKFIDWKIQN